MPTARADLTLEERDARAEHGDRHVQTWNQCCHLVLKCEIAERKKMATWYHIHKHQRWKPPEKQIIYLGSVCYNSYSNSLSTAKAFSRLMEFSHGNNITPAQVFKQLKKKAAKKTPEQASFAVTSSHTDCSALLSRWISHSPWTGLSYLGYTLFSARTVPCSMLVLCVAQCDLIWPPLITMPFCICYVCN